MKILVPVDGSTFTKRMLAYLVAHDEWLGDHHEYTLLHVSPALPSRAVSALDKGVLAAHYAEESEKVFKPIRTFLGKQKIQQAAFVAKVGAAAEVIADVARKGKFDLLLMGSHGHGTFGKLVLGSVTTKVMAQCETPVLVVR
ncbi:universal stress protein [Ideonella sp. A 288]|uniref:universal stress protein n=1 Tax=Ideonella sp. A 288 TaxID=1962181 RepID=UPI000B4BAB1E|nr:universal stress protein [Ideonella sp. A 288]